MVWLSANTKHVNRGSSFHSDQDTKNAGKCDIDQKWLQSSVKAVVAWLKEKNAPAQPQA